MQRNILNSTELVLASLQNESMYHNSINHLTLLCDGHD